MKLNIDKRTIGHSVWDSTLNKLLYFVYPFSSFDYRSKNTIVVYYKNSER